MHRVVARALQLAHIRKVSFWSYRPATNLQFTMKRSFIVFGIAAFTASAAWNCSSHGTGFGGDASTSNDGTTFGDVVIGPACNPCTDFPTDPILDMGAPADSAMLFQATGSAS